MLLEHIFQGNVEVYESSYMAMQLLSMSVMQYGCQMAGAPKEGTKEKKQANTKSTKGIVEKKANSGTVGTGGVQSSGGVEEKRLPDKGSLSNVETRKWYLKQEAKIPDMIDKNLSLKGQAKQAFNLRNKFRTQARELMADRKLAESLHKTDANLTCYQMKKLMAFGIVKSQYMKGIACII